ncbi:unnamed protein product [Vitrella brassicaformis CCMP3155]|uniref:FAD/NAD(P)-binding domain-containing protein n=4 Tax=Vitrella brassicaformis TaxID=1169539 RepID=A0A0G4H2V1_VITBC|nr:unnamed protein product [Vitrella brassicaformis CCMP3155]|mmetsp:Transcript_30673/g.89191  ORF Transcript_30673/g.89191 Transcript_30673/m.89191 type:complete len:664 (+) Transcript_30673:69-2060(+)|eukprot:CEM38011.1 unnamed protein product [Vitrella brassicaformis CCMP3155]
MWRSVTRARPVLPLCSLPSAPPVPPPRPFISRVRRFSQLQHFQEKHQPPSEPQPRQTVLPWEDEVREGSFRWDDYNVCIVGAGPAGFYTAKYLLKKEEMMQIDIIEKLPMPGGLVRYGVAPDHPEVKNVMNDFEEVMNNPRVRYFGNIELQKEVGINQLREWYHVVVLAYGCQKDKMLGLDGEDLEGVLSARRFVFWYNGHPEAFSVQPDLTSSEEAVVIGHGNVALDCARVLTRKISELEKTDISDLAESALRQSAIRWVHVVGRRGVVQAAWTNKELRELTQLDGVLPIVDPAEYEANMNDASKKEMEGNRGKQRMMPIIETMMKNWDRREITDKKIIQLRFLTSPVRITPHAAEPWRADGIELRRNRLEGEPGRQRAVPLDGPDAEPEYVQSNLIIKSVGFKHDAVPGLILSEEDGSVCHHEGRVELAYQSPFQIIGGLYVAGWLKRGPKGVIASNIPDAMETANTILKDLWARERIYISFRSKGREGVVEKVVEDLRIPRRIVTDKDYFQTKNEEIRRGIERGKTASKFLRIKDMIQFLDKSYRDVLDKEQKEISVRSLLIHGTTPLLTRNQRAPEGALLLTSGSELDEIINTERPYNPSSIDGKDGVLLPVQYREFAIRQRSEYIGLGYMLGMCVFIYYCMYRIHVSGDPGRPDEKWI